MSSEKDFKYTHAFFKELINSDYHSSNNNLFQVFISYATILTFESQTITFFKANTRNAKKYLK